MADEVTEQLRPPEGRSLDASDGAPATVQPLARRCLPRDDRVCPPVIGGALVYKDSNHITSVYGATLAPYLGRAVERALREDV